MPVLVFVDSSVWIAGARSPSGPSGAVLRLCEQGMVEPVVCSQVLAEVERNVRRKLPGALRQCRQVFAVLRPRVQPLPTPAEVERASQIVHPKDAPILAAALNSASEYLVSLDRHFLRAAARLAASIRIVTPGELLAALLPSQ
jgi:predicted nucleic acid-binding protein